MMSGSSETHIHAGRNPVVGSDRVKASVTDAGPLGCGRDHTRTKKQQGDGSPQAVEPTTGKNGGTRAVLEIPGPETKNTASSPAELGEDERLTQEMLRLEEAKVFSRRNVIQRSPTLSRKASTPVLARKPDNPVARAKSGGLGGSLPDLTADKDVCKRKRTPEAEAKPTGEATLKELLSQMIRGISELSEVISSAPTTWRDVVTYVSKRDTMARRLANGRLDARMEELAEVPREAKAPRVKAVKKATFREMGTQTEPASFAEVANRRFQKPLPTFRFTTVKEGSPLTLDPEWDLAVTRAKGDERMELGIQRLFRNKFGEIAVPEGEIAHIRTSTWVMGKEEAPPITRQIFRIDDGDMAKLRERLETVLSKMASSGRTKLAIAWDDASRLGEFRKVAEEAAAIHETCLQIHVKPNSRGPTTTVETEAIIVKRAEGKTYASTLRSVRDEVLAKGLSNNIRGVRETKTGDLVLTMAKQKVGKDKENITKALKTILGNENVRATSEKPEGVVHIKDIEAVASKDDVRAAVLEHLGCATSETGRVEVVSLRSAFAGTQSAIIRLSKEDEARLAQSKAIKIGLPSCRVSARQRVDTCYRCWLPGHTARTCKGPDRSKKCINCGGDGHFKKACKERSKCLLCGDSGHPANTTRCRLFRKYLRDNSNAEEERAWKEPKVKRRKSPRPKANKAPTTAPLYTAFPGGMKQRRPSPVSAKGVRSDPSTPSTSNGGK